MFFSDPELMPTLASTLVAACYGCEQNKGVVQQELCVDMLLSLLKSCRNISRPVLDESSESNQQGSSEHRKSQGDGPLKSSRYSARSARLSLGKGGALGNSTRVGKVRNQKDSKATKTCEDSAMRHSALAMDTSLTLHHRFPSSFIDRAEQFFSAEVTNVSEEV